MRERYGESMERERERERLEWRMSRKPSSFPLPAALKWIGRKEKLAAEEFFCQVKFICSHRHIAPVIF